MPLVDDKLSWIQKVLIKTLTCGPVPHHIAFILDGNRRYAKKKNVKYISGHTDGFGKLAQVLGWCCKLGVKEVTLYVFSIENFKRTPEEVEDLMRLAQIKIEEILSNREELIREGICVRVLGNLSLLSEDIQKLLANLVLQTKVNSRYFLNICFSYTSRDEILSSVKEVTQAVRENKLKKSDMSEVLFQQSFYSSNCSNPDLLIRTSGEARLSDFLLWQSSFSILVFVNALWPELTIWNFFIAILQFQHNYHNLKVLKSNMNEEIKQLEEDNLKDEFNEHDRIADKNSRISYYLNYLYHKRMKNLENLVTKQM